MRADTRLAVYPLPETDKPHVMGSALTYARRYSMAAILNVVGEEDDDGNAAQESAKAQDAKANKDTTTALNNLKAAIDGATTVKDLNAMQRDNKEFLMGVPEVTRTYFIERIEERKAALAEGPEGEVDG